MLLYNLVIGSGTESCTVGMWNMSRSVSVVCSGLKSKK